jgi:glutamate-ammonia-ligase adenylyltransferase
MQPAATLPAEHYLSSLKQRAPQAAAAVLASAFHRRAALAVFTQSRFLAEECLAHPDWLLSLREEDLHRGWSAEEYADLLREELTVEPAPPLLDALVLARFRRRQILRILIRDVLDFAPLPAVTEELSNLADAILEVSYRHIRNELMDRYGVPRFVEPSGASRECGMSVIALGKLGGRELNYSSDIDLMFVYSANGDTDGPERISNKEFYKRVANRLTELLSTYTSQGMCYRVDLRLRPDGSLGEVCIPFDSALKYYRTRARDWELQMLIKARAVAGDCSMGRELLDATEPLIYSTTLDFSAVEAVSVTRERISEKLAARRAPNAGLDIKLAPGGIRDIEFLIQCLQRFHGGRVPWVRHGGTLLALSRLSDKGLLSGAEHGKLASAYQFLRELEHRLQFADDRQTHSLPTDGKEMELLARRMPPVPGEPAPSPAELLQRLNSHLESVQEIYARVIHAQNPMYYSMSVAEDPLEAPGEPEAPSRGTASRLIPFLKEVAPSLARAAEHSYPHRNGALFEHFLEKISVDAALLSSLDTGPALRRHVLDLFEHSRHFAEVLVREPGLILELERLGGRPGVLPEEEYLEDASSLRRAFQREMLRIQASSVCLSVPVFETLQLTSDLADASIRVAYRMAVEQMRASQGAGAPQGEMMVIALGRLGMREFDLSSDADLVFVLPEKQAREQVFWTRVTSRLIDILSAYTGDGQLFAVDARLRPNGNAGPLVQPESAYKEYFANRAEAWEGLSYMKARAVAGDLDRATGFLNELQDLDWRRYGQSGRSRKDLRAMRARLEKEQGASNSLKAGRGGYYDIDFLLLYLRLKGAGIFFKVLNTPARIDVVEKMGHLDRSDADFLRDAAVFYRAIDHGMRVYSGHAGGRLPTSEAALESLTALSHRWIPEHLHSQTLPELLAQFRERIRTLFDTQFE